MSLSLVVREIVKFLFPLLLVLGFYVVANGHLTPGGGFQGGVIIAAAFVLLFIAFGKKKIEGTVSLHLISMVKNIGVLSFFMFASAGFFFGKGFFVDVFPKGTPGDLFSAEFILFENFAVGIEVAMGMLLLVLSLSMFTFVEGEKEIV